MAEPPTSSPGPSMANQFCHVKRGASTSEPVFQRGIWCEPGQGAAKAPSCAGGASSRTIDEYAMTDASWTSNSTPGHPSPDSLAPTRAETIATASCSAKASSGNSPTTHVYNLPRGLRLLSARHVRESQTPDF